MFFVHLFALSGAFVLGFSFCLARRKRTALPGYAAAALFLAALSIRLFLAAWSRGFGSDTACFIAWADRLLRLGPGAFYSPDVFTDYPPGYLYVLWLLGGIRSLLGLESYSVPHLLLMKLPSILCDMACGLVMFHEARKRLSENHGFFLCAAYLFNPAVILNSSLWGQVDSLYTLALLLLCLYLARGKMYPAYIAFGIGVLIKLQTLLFAPLLLAGIIDWLAPSSHPASGRSGTTSALILPRLLHTLFQGLSVLAGMVILCLPFGLRSVWEQALCTVGSYPYAAVNACNFWGLCGLNWVSQDNVFLGIPYRFIGMCAIVATVVLVLALGLRWGRRPGKYPFLGALLIVTVFLFSVRMHERYLYPALALLLLAYIHRPSGLTYLCYSCFTVLHFYNTAQVLFFYDPEAYDRRSPFILLVSAGMLAGGMLLYRAAAGFCSDDVQGGSGQGAAISGSSPDGTKSPLARLQRMIPWQTPPQPSRRAQRLRPADFLWITAITLLYSAFALYDLGDRQAPASSWDMDQNQSIELDFGSQIPASLSYYIAPWHGRSFLLEEMSPDTGEWIPRGELLLENVFTWQEAALDTNCSHIRLTLTDDQASLLELAFLDASGSYIAPRNAADYPALFDEAELYPEAPSFRNGMYFDEIYHGRTAYEFLNGLTSYENTHPPMGKIFIAMGVALFGMNPFGWRIAGALFGIAMVPLIYLFARRISGSTALSALACSLFAFDFMHFTQTRLATIDVFITFFVLLMYYFMYQYSCLSFYDTSLKRTLLPLGACGIAMGFGVASKWTGVYAGAGLALIFFSVLYRRYREYRFAAGDPGGSTEGISHDDVLRRFSPYVRHTVLFCLVFFVAVPAAIYLLSYLPFRDYSDRGLIGRMLYNQHTMFSYHSGLDATHPYSSAWYEWPTIRRPIWYYSRVVSGGVGEGLREGISAFGNPAVWWPGIPAALYMAYLWIRERDRTAAFLTVAYLAQYLPWFFVTRVTFIYHYFPSVAFVALMIMYSLMGLKGSCSRRSLQATGILYALLVFVLFLLFYPVLSGQPVDAAFVDRYLRWFPGWVLTAR